MQIARTNAFFHIGNQCLSVKSIANITSNFCHQNYEYVITRVDNKVIF